MLFFYLAFHFFGQSFAISVTSFCGTIWILPIVWENYQKHYRKPIYRHISNYQHIINIDLRLLQIIGDIESLLISLLYQKYQRNYQKKLILKKHDLLLTPMYRQSSTNTTGETEERSVKRKPREELLSLPYHVTNRHPFFYLIMTFLLTLLKLAPFPAYLSQNVNWP